MTIARNPRMAGLNDPRMRAAMYYARKRRLARIADTGPEPTPLISAKHWRFEWSAGATNAWVDVQEIEFYSDETTEIIDTATITSSSILQPTFSLAAFTDGDLTTEAGGVIYDGNSSATFLVDMEFATAQPLHHFGRHDRGDAPNEIMSSPRLIGVYHSDDGVTWTHHFSGFVTSEQPAAWQYVDSPEVAGVTADGVNKHVMVYNFKGNSDRFYEFRELKFLLGAVEKCGAGVPPLSADDSDHLSATFEADHAFLNDIQRTLSWDYNLQAQTRIHCIVAEMAVASVIDTMEVTAGAAVAQTPKDMTLMVGDGRTFVPVLRVQNEIAWTEDETRSYTL